MHFTMYWQILNILVLWILQTATIYADGSDAAASCLEFLGILLGFFFVAAIILIGVMIYRNWKLRRLTHPTKERIYKH